MRALGAQGRSALRAVPLTCTSFRPTVPAGTGRHVGHESTNVDGPGSVALTHLARWCVSWMNALADPEQ